MLAAVRRSPELWREAADIAAGTELPGPAPPRAVVVAGMGGSGIAGDLAAVVAAERGRAPVVAVKGSRLPAWVGPDTPVVAVSHSGATRETLACADAALGAGLPLLAVTSGGALAARAGDAGVPTVEIPGHLPPRASLPYLVAPVLVALEAAGVLPGVGEELAAVPEAVAGVLADPAEPADPELLAALDGAAPWFISGPGAGALVGLRGRCQINENAERVAFASVLPEAGHNEVVGWAGTAPLPVAAVVVDDPAAAPDVRAAIRLAVEIATCFTAVHRITLPGGATLERAATGIARVDRLSVELALAADVVPTPVAAIDALKRRLAEEAGDP